MKKTIDPQFFQILSDEALIAIVALDDEGKCFYSNSFAKNMFDFSENFDVDTFRIHHLYPEPVPDRRIRLFSEECLKIEGHFHEILMRKNSGNNFVASLLVKKIKLHGHPIVLLLIQDITAQKKLQRELTEKQTAITQAYEDLLRQNKQLKELDIAKNLFLAVITHELRTPLSAMISSAEILKMKLYDNEAQKKEFTEMIYEQGQHLTNLINDILDFAKIQSNKMDYYVQEGSIVPIIESEVAQLETMAKNSDISIQVEQTSSPCVCYFDEVRIRQVLTNLINNAIKYNHARGSVTIRTEETPQFVVVSVQDTGPGIAKENLKKIFNEFETLGKTTHHAKGTGLGLPISLRMVQAQGGEIYVESEEGKGATFYFKLPRQRVLKPENYRSRPDQTGSGDLAA